MTKRVWCGWNAHERCDGQYCSCECHELGRAEWDAWQAHVARCHWCRDVVRGVRLGRCDKGDRLVAEWNRVIHEVPR